MQLLAEYLRWLLIGLQIVLVAWMLVSGLWRNLPTWTAWIALEAVSRALFDPGTNYWHHIWMPMQPAIILLLGCAAFEARCQAGRHSHAVLVMALSVVPIGMSLSLPSLITMRIWFHVIVSASLLFAEGTDTARWHARILCILCASIAAAGWPAPIKYWWILRASLLAVYCMACFAWMWLFFRRTDAAVH